MSRIHEALKKAEQERALSQPQGAVDSAAVALEPQLGAEPIASPAVRAGGAPALTEENALARIRQTNWHPDPKTMLFFNSEEHASGMEEFRTLRSRLYQARQRQTLAKLLITSPLPKEGKSFTTANLAQVMVRQQGRRALMIDADLRNPQMHELLGAEPAPGLSEYLSGVATDEFSIVQRGPMENLFLIPAGRRTENPAELVANGRMRFLLNRLEPLFDWILIDSPPAALVSDAVLLANYCDGVILVLRSNNTPVEAARRARKEFADRNVVGVVLNGISPELSPYAQYYYSAYAGGGQAQAKN